MKRLLFLLVLLSGCAEPKFHPGDRVVHAVSKQKGVVLNRLNLTERMYRVHLVSPATGEIVEMDVADFELQKQE